MTVVLTAGHVDHGKSALVRALTGTDPDRLEEERRRGLTIDLGFASTTLRSGAVVGFVDVPGHERFVANMLAGAGPGGGAGQLACLFVVDATEGWRAQSEEHMRIVDVLGIGRAVIAVTKADLVDADTVELVRLDVAERTTGTVLAGAPVVAVSARTGEGLDDLRAEVEAMLDTPVDAVAERGRPRLWIDRVFVIAGSGTVVTGTLTGGSLDVGADVAVEPGGHTARIRGIEEHGAACDSIGPGRRVALNLAGVDRRSLRRGMAVVERGRWRLATVIDATLQVFGSPGRAIGRRGAYVAHIGSAERTATVRVIGADDVTPGRTGFVRLRLDEPVVCQPGDRYVLRESGRQVTVGGGELLDVDPVATLGRAHPARGVEHVLAERGFVHVDELERLTGERREPTHGQWVADPAAVAAVTEEISRRVAEAGPAGLDLATLDEHQRLVVAALERDGGGGGAAGALQVVAGRVRPTAGADELAGHPVVAQLEAAGVAPEAPDVDRAVLRQLQRRGELVERDGIWFHGSAITTAADTARILLHERPEGFTVSQFRQALGVSRRHAMPLLAELDARRITRRAGDVRLAGAAAGG